MNVDTGMYLSATCRLSNVSREYQTFGNSPDASNKSTTRSPETSTFRL